MRLATWNVNSIRTRVERVTDWLARADVDVLAMQETKCTDAQFPALAFEALGYEIAHVGYNQWNGVAIASRVGLDEVSIGFDGQPGFGKDGAAPEAEARALGFESINADLIYGLPMQTPETFQRTLAQISRLRPDRIALYAYAHLPERFKPQRRIHAQDLPPAASKLAMLDDALKALMHAGYDYVGMDHFALPDDALAVAKRQGRLHRNFQGYSTQPDCDLIALGVSAIGRIGATYSQNAKTMEEYCDALDQGHLPIVRGLALTRDDMLRRAVIMALMCQGNLQFESINVAWLIDFKTYFAGEMQTLEEMQNQGLVELSPTGIQVTAMGWFFVRGVAMVFDRYLQMDRNRTRFSKII